MLKTWLLIALLCPLVTAPLLLLGRRAGARVGWGALLSALVTWGACLQLALLPAEERMTLRLDWVPELGVALSFTVDGLSSFFGLLASTIGCLVVFYSIFYLAPVSEKGSHDQPTNELPLERPSAPPLTQSPASFFFLILLFLGAMLLTVFSSNLLVLFTAWELTGILSFLLIGFHSDEQISQRGARMALLTTGLTGLCLLVGVILLHQVFGSFELDQLIGARAPPGSEALHTSAFLLCFIGICGKSALFPFSYWLPSAMAAPTPVSAYLHSATLVKLGVFLTARLLPVFASLETWSPTLLTIGFLTFLIGALLACLSFDLKGVLAYTTVAQLGLLVGQYGWLGGAGDTGWTLLHVLNHSLYKACLFLVVGIIDHSTRTRDLRRLGGLFRKLPLTGASALVGLAALAGLPLSSGFISKELLLESALEFSSTTPGLLGLWPLTALVLGSLLHVFLALRIMTRVFFRPTSHELEAHFHAPPRALEIAPLLLACVILFFGVQPELFGRFIRGFSATSSAHAELALWHGFTPIARFSSGIFAAAGLLFVWGEKRQVIPAGLPRALEAERIFEQALQTLTRAAQSLDRALGFQRPSLYLLILITFLSLVMGTALLDQGRSWSSFFSRTHPLPAQFEGWLRFGLVLLIATGTWFAATWRRPIPQLFAVSTVGLGVAFYYVLYRAPDLALTQLLVESATLLLVLFVTLRFKLDAAEKLALPRRSVGSRALRIGVSWLTGISLGLCTLIFQNDHFDTAGDFYLQSSRSLAHGANAVNTVVVDFRGFDTLLEISVLLIAALGVLGLLSRTKSVTTSTPPPALPDFPELFPVPRDFILRAIAFGAFLPLNAFSLYVFFRGHNAPGGGFVAGLITALSLWLLSFVLGLTEFQRRFRFEPLRIAVLGIALALSSAFLPLFFGYSLLHHIYVELGPLSLNTPMLFDAGVFLTVVGVSLLLMIPLLRSIHQRPAFTARERTQFSARAQEPIDFAPALTVLAPPRSDTPRSQV